MKHFLCGFPVTSVLDAAGTGTPIPGGQRVHGKPARGEVPELQDLKARCSEINNKTIRNALARRPNTPEQRELAEIVWSKVLDDAEKHRISTPLDLESFPLDQGFIRPGFRVISL